MWTKENNEIYVNEILNNNLIFKDTFKSSLYNFLRNWQANSSVWINENTWNNWSEGVSIQQGCLLDNIVNTLYSRFLYEMKIYNNCVFNITSEVDNARGLIESIINAYIIRHMEGLSMDLHLFITDKVDKVSASAENASGYAGFGLENQDGQYQKAINKSTSSSSSVSYLFATMKMLDDNDRILFIVDDIKENLLRMVY